MAYAFRGGILFKDEKLKNERDTLASYRPDAVTLHIKHGELNVAALAAGLGGRRVLRGQMLAPGVHSPVSGKVTEVVPISGGAAVKIAADAEDEISPDAVKVHKKLADCTPEEIIARIRDCGICDMGADGDPTADKLAHARGKADTCIINCAEREPYVTCDLTTVTSRPNAVINGLKIFLRALGIRRGVIAVPDVGTETIKKLSELTKKSGMVSVMTTSSKYPAGDERRVVYSYTGRELPPGADPTSFGCVVFNVQTCAAVYDAFVTGSPLVSRVVSVGGDCVKERVDVNVPLGTSFADLVKFAGGVVSEPALILDGGPLRGRKCTLDDTVTKTTRALLLFSSKEAGRQDADTDPVCVKCGRCVSLCPERLMPNYIYNYIRDNKANAAISAGALRCVGCGICSYICPGKAPVAELIAEFRHARAERAALPEDTEVSK